MTYEDIAAFLADSAGAAAPAAGTVPFLSDIGTTIAEGWTGVKTAANGVTQSVRTIASGGVSSGTALLTMDVGVAGAAIAPLLGVGAGIGLYNVAPDFWDNVAEKLIAAGETINGQVVAYLGEDGQPYFSDTTLDAYYQALSEANIYDSGYYEWDGEETGGLEIQTPVRGGYTIRNVTRVFDADPLLDPYPIYCVGSGNGLYYGFRTSAEDGKAAGFKTFGHYASDGTVDKFVAIATEAFTATISGIEADGHLVMTSGSYNSSSYTYNDKTVYYWSILNSWNASSFFANNPANSIEAIAWTLAFGAGVNAVNKYLDSNASNPSLFDSIGSFMDNLGLGSIDLPGVGEDTVVGYPLNPTAGTQEGVADLDIPWEKLWDWLMNPTIDLTGVGDIAGADAIEGSIDDSLPFDITFDPSVVIDVPDDPPIPPDWEWDIPPVIIPDIDTGSGGKLFEVYSVTASDLNTLGGYLWSTDILETLQKIWSNPLESCIALFRVWATPSTGANKQVYLGNTAIPGLSCPVVSNQFTRINLGSVNVAELNKNVGDYSPYTQISIYLPFIGIQELDTDEIMAGSLNVQYVVDMWTGTCIAELRLTKEGSSAGTLLYVYNGNMAQQIPLTSSTFNGMFSALLAAGGAFASVASGGSLMPAMAMGVGGLLTHDMVHVQRSGLISANAGIMTDRTPRLILSRRNICNATAYNELSGFPANKTKILGNCFGFTRVRAINLKVNATDNERNEIEKLLAEGVIF